MIIVVHVMNKSNELNGYRTMAILDANSNEWHQKSRVLDDNKSANNQDLTVTC